MIIPNLYIKLHLAIKLEDLKDFNLKEISSLLQM